MRLIVPLQGVVQGRGGLIWGSLIPCALFYCLQLYLKRRRRPGAPSSSSSSSHLHRSPSRSNLSSLPRACLSSRASPIAAPNDSPYYIGLHHAANDPYHRLSNPHGILQLGLSENRLSFDLIEKWISENLNDAMIGAGGGGGLDISGIAAYQPFDGLIELKLAVAGFMSRVVGKKVNFDPSQIVLTAGATPAIEILSFCLADTGNGLLVPTPYYPGFDRDVRWRTGVEIIPVHCRSTDNFILNMTVLDQAYNQARKRGVKVRGLLIANPSNPVGNVLPRETLCSILDFAQEKNIHVICDEIFAGSVHGDEDFVSVAEVIEGEIFDKSRVHLVYGLSKDLSIPGFRVGVIYSYNENVLTAAKKLTRFCSISAPAQRLLIPMLLDTRFIDEYMEINKKRVRDMYELFVEGLKQVGIDCAKSSAGSYCWANMSRLIPSYGEKGELELWQKLLNISKVNVTPGSACHCIEPGWFRCCFTMMDQEDIPVVIHRIRKIAETSNSQS